MKRRYTIEESLEKLNQLFKRFPMGTFGADVLVGFPGEGEKEFLETCEIIEISPLNWLHVFSLFPKTKYSRRKNAKPGP